MKNSLFIKLFFLCFIIFCCKNDIANAEPGSSIDAANEASDNIEEYIYIIGKKPGNLNDKDIEQITNFEDMNGKCYKIDKLYKYGISGGYAYFSNYYDSDGESKIFCNFLTEEWREAHSRYIKSSFTLGGKDSLISVFKFKASDYENESWVCISKTTRNYKSFKKGYFVNIFTEECGNTSCSIEETHTNSKFKNAMKGVKNYESFYKRI